MSENGLFWVPRGVDLLEYAVFFKIILIFEFSELFWLFWTFWNFEFLINNFIFKFLIHLLPKNTGFWNDRFYFWFFELFRFSRFFHFFQLFSNSEIFNTKKDVFFDFINYFHFFPNSNLINFIYFSYILNYFWFYYCSVPCFW